MSRSNLYTELTEILPFLPILFVKKNQTLDVALDGYRSHKTLSSSALDLILMSYRYAHLFEMVAKDFSSKKIKPPPLKDLWLAGFAALMTRDKMPAFAIVSECVEVAKTVFGAHTAPVTNAFLRSVDRRKNELLMQLAAQPEVMFPEWLQSRWAAVEYRSTLARAFSERPEGGVWGFDQTLVLSRQDWSDTTFAEQKFQAMNAGSHEFCEWVTTHLSASDKSFVDTCSAPGGKAIYLIQWILKQKREPHFLLCEAKSKRLTALKENLKRWDIGYQDKLYLHEWGTDATPAPLGQADWDFVLADVPCSGSGTLLTRPDVLLRDWSKEMASLKDLQWRILSDVMELSTKKLFVSICSIDPTEVAHISKILNKSPDFCSWNKGSLFAAGSEGITAWYCET